MERKQVVCLHLSIHPSIYILGRVFPIWSTFNIYQYFISIYTSRKIHIYHSGSSPQPGHPRDRRQHDPRRPGQTQHLCQEGDFEILFDGTFNFAKLKDM